MKNKIRKIISILLLITILITITTPILNAATEIKVEQLQLTHNGAIIKISSTDKVKALTLYKKSGSGNYIKFYEYNDTEFNEKSFFINNIRLSTDGTSDFKAVAIDSIGNELTKDFQIGKLPEKPEAKTTTPPLATPTPSPSATPTTSSKPSSSAAPSISTTATKVSLNKTSVKINVGDTVKLKATVSPNNSNTTVTWTSSNTKVATVNNSGSVKGIKKGSATITVKTSNGKSAQCKITVEEYTQTAANLLKTLNKFSKKVQSDYKRGVYWRYKWVGKDKTFEQAISSGRRQGTCVSLVVWGLRDIGALSNNKLLRVTNDGKELKGAENVSKYATVMTLSSRKTPKQLEGTKYELKAGDIVGWDFGGHGHINVYAGNKKFYDSGRMGTNGCSSYLGSFKTFGPVSGQWNNKGIRWIIRLKK